MSADKTEKLEDSVASALVRVVLFVVVTPLVAAVLALIPVGYAHWITHLNRTGQPVPQFAGDRVSDLYILIGITGVICGALAAVFGPALWNRFGRTPHVSLDETRAASEYLGDRDKR